jgi:hypothetical protein
MRFDRTGYVVDNKIRVRLESKEDTKKRGLDSPDARSLPWVPDRIQPTAMARVVDAHSSQPRARS